MLLSACSLMFISSLLKFFDFLTIIRKLKHAAEIRLFVELAFAKTSFALRHELYYQS